MAIGVGNTILASDYNSIQSTVASILGSGSGDRGYGQAVSSGQVAATNTITASQMQNLKSDLDKIRYHQANAASTAPSVSAGGVIYASDWSTYSSQASTLDTNRLSIASEQATLTTGVNPQIASGTWNNNRTHIVTASFGSADIARYFFNAGGEIRIIPTMSGHSSSTTKGGRWNNLFTTAGSIRFRAYDTVASGGTGSSIGWYNLSGTQQIFTIVDSGTYSNNDLTITASKTATVLTLNIQYNDDGSTGIIDENVDGTLTSTVSHYRATGSYVSVTGPTISTTQAP
jgi:hypothetical protein